jgi:hypothetical protein
MANRDKFGQDLNTLTSRLTENMDSEKEKSKVVCLKERLLDLQKQNVVKINHSAMELVCAKHLIQKRYDAQIEYVLSELLTCDLFATKGYGNLIVEVETGFIPPDHALDPLTYLSARLASKIIRYSSYAGKFALGVPPHYVLLFPRALAIPPRRRTTADIEFIKKLCDAYYQNPPVTEEDIRNARIQDIYIIDVDRVKVLEIDPEAYMKRALHKEFAFAWDSEGEAMHPRTATLFDFEEKNEQTA